ncbi:MAG: type II toxin-antitoxin system VapC family toxin [Actinomycetota bacterium]
MIVVDASVVVAALTDSAAAGEAARRVLGAGGAMHVPDLFDLEVVSAARRLWLSATLGRDEFEWLAVVASRLPARRWAAHPFIERITALAANVTPYDAAYVALAEFVSAPLFTFDTRLAAAPGSQCEIRLVS